MQIVRKPFRGYTDGYNQTHHNLKKLINLRKENEETPAPDAFPPSNHEAISRMMLKYPEPPKTHEPTRHEIQCNTCRKTFDTYRGRKQHREQSATRIQQKFQKKHTTHAQMANVTKYSKTKTHLEDT